jgi:hypothetical protein
MTNASRIVVVLAAFAASLLWGCRDQSRKTDENTPNAAEILADREDVPAANALIRLQEEPAFPVDEQGRPFAMVGDGDERLAAASDKPLSLEESELKQ